jgi:hypothetical protein
MPDNLEFDRYGISQGLTRKGLSDRQIADLLRSDSVVEAGMPIGPGTILNLLKLGKSVPGVVRRLRGMFSRSPQSTAPSNTLRDVVLSDKPANVSRRGFLTNPIQTAVDIPQTLREIGISEESIRSGDEIGNWPEPGSMLDTLGDADEADRIRDVINEKLFQTGYRSNSRLNEWGYSSPSTVSPGPTGVIRDIETMMRVYRDQVLKDAAQKAGRSFEEQVRLEQGQRDEPGVVATIADTVRRRYRR